MRQTGRVVYWLARLYRDAAAAAAVRQLTVGAFTISPTSGTVPPNGQAVISVECAPDKAGMLSEVRQPPPPTPPSLSLYLCLSHSSSCVQN